MAIENILIDVFVITEKNRRSLSTTKDLSFTCKDVYKLYATVNVTESVTKLSTLSAFRLVCIPAYKNLFCLNTTNEEWKRSICNIVGNKIKCPLFETYKTYSKFFFWKITTFVIKVEYKINGTKYITASKSLTPYFKCPDIARIGPHSKMFLKSVGKHNKKDCSCWLTSSLHFKINDVLQDFFFQKENSKKCYGCKLECSYNTVGRSCLQVSYGISVIGNSQNLRGNICSTSSLLKFNHTNTIKTCEIRLK